MGRDMPADLTALPDADLLREIDRIEQALLNCALADCRGETDRHAEHRLSAYLNECTAEAARRRLLPAEAAE
jgi:hypothetical protein